MEAWSNMDSAEAIVCDRAKASIAPPLASSDAFVRGGAMLAFALGWRWVGWPGAIVPGLDRCITGCQNCDAAAAVPVKSGVSGRTSLGLVGSTWKMTESRVGTRWFGDSP